MNVQSGRDEMTSKTRIDRQRPKDKADKRLDVSPFGKILISRRYAATDDNLYTHT